MKKYIICLLTLLTLIFSGCESIIGNDEEFGAGKIIKKYLKSPRSYSFREGQTLWRGKNDFGNSVIVKIKYDAKNSFGVYIANCHIVAYSEDDSKLQWHPKFGITPCKSFPQTVLMIKTFAKLNDLGTGSVIGMK